MLGEPQELLAEGARRAAPHSRVDLVEHERRTRGAVARREADGEGDARELAAGRGACDRRGGEAGVRQFNCNCYYQVDVNRAPDAVSVQKYGPVSLTQGTWSYPATNRLLFQAGYTYSQQGWTPSRAPGTTNTDISITELSTGYLYNAATGIAYGRSVNRIGQQNGRASAAYVTGSHAFKAGIFLARGESIRPDGSQRDAAGDLFIPQSHARRRADADPRPKTRRRALVTAGCRPSACTRRINGPSGSAMLNLDCATTTFAKRNPAQTRPAGYFVPAFNFPELNNVPNWKDSNPRIGATYDLFGNGKTAIKGSIGRYVIAEATSIATASNPANAISTSATRTWNDLNQDYVPDCDLKSPLSNGECLGLTNNVFGTIVQNTLYADEVLLGSGVRPYTWQGAASIQHEVAPGVGVTVGNFRTWDGNFLVTVNQAVAAGDYSPYCIAVPADARSGGGGGNQLCGLQDLNPNAFGFVS